MRHHDGAAQREDEQLLGGNAVDQGAAPDKQQTNPVGAGANNHEWAGGKSAWGCGDLFSHWGRGAASGQMRK